MNDWLKITAIDVGKGDCILLQRGDHAVLIDTGYEDTAGKVLGELGAAGVKKLEALILTHFHKDHIGGVSAVLKSFGACRIYMPDFVKDSEHFYTLVRTAEDLNTEIIRVVSDRRTDFFGAQIRMFPSPFVPLCRRSSERRHRSVSEGPRRTLRRTESAPPRQQKGRHGRIACGSKAFCGCHYGQRGQACGRFGAGDAPCMRRSCLPDLGAGQHRHRMRHGQQGCNKKRPEWMNPVFILLVFRYLL